MANIEMADILSALEGINVAIENIITALREKEEVKESEPQGQLNLFDYQKPLFKITTPIRLIELFAGVGSQAMALRNIGAVFEHYRAIEFDKYAIASYNAIHGTAFQTMDIKDVCGADLGIVDRDKYMYMVTYSFPCQDLSVAGRMKGMEKGDGTRSGLLWEVERLLEECGEELPQVLLMENVPQIHGKKNAHNFNDWCDFLEKKGYSNYWQDLNAKDYGVAQNRQRTFMVSILGEYRYEFPKPVPLTKKMADYLEPEVAENYYVNSEKAEQLIVELVENGKLEKQVSNTVRGGGRGSLDRHQWDAVLTK